MEFYRQPVPFNATFWRVRRDCFNRPIDSLSHRSPLFNTRLCTSPSRSLAIDTLHTVYLGIMQRLVATILMRVLWCNPWKTRLENRVKRLEADMFVFYDKQKVPHQTRVNMMTPKMLPEEHGPNHHGGILKLKASETYVVLKFAVYELEVHADCNVYKHSELLGAARALVTWVQTMHRSPAKLSRDQYNTLVDAAQRTLLLSERAEVHPTPKFHTFGHVTARPHFWAGKQPRQTEPMSAQVCFICF